MRILRWTGAFAKDVKRLTKRGYDLNKLQRILNALQEGDALPPSARPHLLSGEWT
jgi:mRNA interferase YafQ